MGETPFHPPEGSVVTLLTLIGALVALIVALVALGMDVALGMR